MERLHARTALAVAVDGGDFGREAGETGDGVGADTGEFTRATDVAHGDVFDGGRIDLRVALEERADDLCAYFIEAGGDELAAAATGKRRAGAIDDDGILKFQLTILTNDLGRPMHRAKPATAAWYRIARRLRIILTTARVSEASQARSR